MVAAMITPGRPGRTDDVGLSTASVTIPAPALRCPSTREIRRYAWDRLTYHGRGARSSVKRPRCCNCLPLAAAYHFCGEASAPTQPRMPQACQPQGVSPMSRSYHVIDADGHVLEPFTLWNDYLDPAYRERAPKLVKDENGKDRLLLEEQILGSTQGFGGIGG